ncbi:MAG: hypothetical protein AB7O96_03030 [Pseudobdellovibrionaceae bacterium]
MGKFLLGYLLVLGFSSSALAELPPTANEVRTIFENSDVPTTYDLHQSKWTCQNIPTFKEQDHFELYMFNFVVVPHNNRMLFSNDSTVAEWVPRWFSEYQGMRTSIAFKTKNFVSGCQGRVQDCLVSGEEMRNFGYLRLNKQNQLTIEWTTSTQMDDLRLTPVSRDTEETSQKVWMYSLCTQDRH